MVAPLSGKHASHEVPADAMAASPLAAPSLSPASTAAALTLSPRRGRRSAVSPPRCDKRKLWTRHGGQHLHRRRRGVVVEGVWRTPEPVQLGREGHVPDGAKAHRRPERVRGSHGGSSCHRRHRQSQGRRHCRHGHALAMTSSSAALVCVFRAAMLLRRRRHHTLRSYGNKNIDKLLLI